MDATISLRRACALSGPLYTLALALALALPRTAQAQAQDTAGARPARSRCPGCAPAPAPSARAASTGRPVRRGTAAAEGRVPLTDIAIGFAGARYERRVDADCHINPRAGRGGPAAYYVVMYPWFGQRVAPDKPQWRVDLEIRPGHTDHEYDEFVFSFHDGPRAATIQTIRGAERMGSGTVRVTRHDQGARFELSGRSKEGSPVHAVLDCPVFQGGEGGGG